MASSKEVIVRGYAITVAAPLHRPISTPKRRNSHYLEEVFKNYRDEENIPEHRENFNRCIAIIKFANSYCGSLENVTHGNSCENCVIELTFRFDDLERMLLFQKEVLKGK